MLSSSMVADVGVHHQDHPPLFCFTFHTLVSVVVLAVLHGLTGTSPECV